MTGPGIGIIGTNWGVGMQLPAFHAAGMRVVALAGRQPTRTYRLAKKLNIPYATTDWRTLITHEDVALVSIVTPPSLHRMMVEAALAAGKHVVCEKPMAVYASEAWHMLGAAQTRPGQLALVDHELRFLPALQAARNLVRAKGIGQFRRAEVRAVTSTRTDLRQSWNWWSDAGKGGGVLGALSTHQTDILRYVLQDEVAAAQGFLSSFTTTSVARSSEDLATFHLRFVRGGVAVIIASMAARIEEPQSITLYGDAGVLRFVDGHLYHGQHGEELRDITPPHTVSFPAEIQWLTDTNFAPYAHATVYFAHALRKALTGDLTAVAPAATFYDGVRVQQVVDAVRSSSMRSGDWIAISGLTHAHRLGG